MGGSSGSNPIPPGGTYQFEVILTPVAGKPYQDDGNAVTVNITGGNTYPVLLEAQYSTPAIIPFMPLTDSSEVMLLGFLNSMGQTAIKVAKPLDTNCEEDSWFQRQFDMKSPEQVKQLEKFLLRYERYTTATPVTVTYTSISPMNQFPIAQRRILTSGIDGLLCQTLFDGSIAGTIISVKVFVSGTAGPLSVAMFILYYEPRGETIEAT
jgi:hypothetical protein